MSVSDAASFQPLGFSANGEEKPITLSTRSGRIRSTRMTREVIMTNAAPIGVLTVDDHPLLREGLAAVINCQPDMSLIATAATGTEAMDLFRASRPDVTLMDLSLPDLCGIDVMIAIRSEFPDARVIMLTTFERDIDVQRALKAGARGYLLKSMGSKRILDTIRQVHSGQKCVAPEIAVSLAEFVGEKELSRREVEVLHEVAAGTRNRDIARRLFIAEDTVKVHLRNIREKLGANDRTHSVTIAAKRGFIRLQ
jgi:DNA-binding NarL/FixJ family response regulator